MFFAAVPVSSFYQRCLHLLRVAAWWKSSPGIPLQMLQFLRWIDRLLRMMRRGRQKLKTTWETCWWSNPRMESEKGQTFKAEIQWKSELRMSNEEWCWRKIGRLGALNTVDCKSKYYTIYIYNESSDGCWVLKQSLWNFIVTSTFSFGRASFVKIYYPRVSDLRFNLICINSKYKRVETSFTLSAMFCDAN